MTLTVRRRDDMSPDAALILHKQEDGDVVVAIWPTASDTGFSKSVEFCSCGSGGGRSPKVLDALRNLFDAMEQDNEESPIPDD